MKMVFFLSVKIKKKTPKSPQERKKEEFQVEEMREKVRARSLKGGDTPEGNNH